MIKVRVINHQSNNDEWFTIFVNVDHISYIESITSGDYVGNYLMAFNNRDFILKYEDLDAIFK